MKRTLYILLVLAVSIATGWYCFRRSYHPKNRIPPAALRALEGDSNLILYSLSPDRFFPLVDGTLQAPPDNEPKFHDYRILGQTVLTAPESRRVVVNTIRDAVRNWDGALAACFEPRHGVRVTDASGTHDFLICFSCCQIYVFSQDNTQKQLGIRASAQPLNEILTAAHVPLPTQ